MNESTKLKERAGADVDKLVADIDTNAIGVMDEVVPQAQAQARESLGSRIINGVKSFFTRAPLDEENVPLLMDAEQDYTE